MIELQMDCSNGETASTTDFVRECVLDASLDSGWAGAVVLGDRWPGVAIGSTGRLTIRQQAFDIVVTAFHTPWRGGSQWIRFVDPIRAAPAFHHEAFGSLKNVSAQQVVLSRKPCHGPGGFSTANWSEAAIDGLTLVEVLQEICALNTDWHFRWDNGEVVVGLVSEGEAESIATANEADVAGGFEADLHLGIPKLGERVQAKVDEDTIREGTVTRLEINYPERPLVARMTVHEQIARPARVRSTGTSLVPGIVSQLDPLTVEVQFDDGFRRFVKGRNQSINLKDCELHLPVKCGDSVLVVWPRHSLTTSPLLILPLSDLPGADHLKLVTRSAEMLATSMDFNERRG